VRGQLSDAVVPIGLIPPTDPTDAIDMNTYRNTLSRLLRDERGGEVLEYALVAGLIVVAAIAVIGSVGTKVLARWNSLNASM
jgi:Flp pilus assembly pilin Flp